MRGWLNKNQRLKQINTRLKNENAKLRQIIKKQDKRIKELETKLEQALLQIEELQRIIFAKKKKSNKDDNDQGAGNNDSDSNNNKPKKERDPSSYSRLIPKTDEITDYREYHIDNCPDCGSSLTRIKVVVRYLEDILPLGEWYRALKKVRRKLITTGYCPHCQKRVAAEPLAKQTVSLGDNVKQFVVFTNTILRLSYDQIADFLASSIHFRLSDGEIANILEEQADKLRPEYERIWANIRGQPGAHYDETTWRVQKDSKTKGNYVWVMTGTNTTDTIFLLGKNRGKGKCRESKG